MAPDKQKTRPDNSSYDHKHAERLNARADKTDPMAQQRVDIRQMFTNRAHFFASSNVQA